MLQAPTSDTKQQADSARANAPAQDVSRSKAPPLSPQRQRAAQWQQAFGNRATLRMLSLPRPAVQAKLTINQPGDAYEQEADRVADHVMRMSDADIAVSRAPAQVSRKCAACEKEEEEKKLQMKPAGTARPVAEAPPTVHDLLREAGQPLGAETRAFSEPRFGSDFSGVRIHTGMRAAESARSVRARAYTVGQHVVFGHDQYAPRTADGFHLLAHELAHTLQQRGGVAGLQRQPDPPEAPPPAPPDLEARLKVIEEAGGAIGARLDQIIRTGGPIPDTKNGAKVIGAFIIDVEGYPKPKEMRTINGADTDALGAGAPVFHAPTPTPTDRVLSQTQGPRTEAGGRKAAITGPRRESINSHINDAEIKGFEFIIPKLPKGAKGTIYFTTALVPMGQKEITPYPACSGCIRASFETAGWTQGVDVVSHAPVHPTGTANMGTSQPPHSEHDEPITNPQGLKPGSTHMSPRDADVDLATGRVVPGPNTDAAAARRAQNSPLKPAGGKPNAETTASGEITVPQRGLVTPVGGKPRPVTTTEGDIMLPNGPTGGPGIARGIAGAVALYGIQLLLNYGFGKLISDFDEARIKNAWDDLLPEILTAIDRKQGEAEKLLKQTGGQKMIYANIRGEIIYVESIDNSEGGGIDKTFVGTKFTGVEVSTQSFQGEGEPYRETIVLDEYDHLPFTYSVPFTTRAAVTPAQCLPAFRIIHDTVAVIRAGLIAARAGASAGQLVAIDELEVAQQATDFMGFTPFSRVSAAERFDLAFDAVKRSISVLPPDPQRRLAYVKGMLIGLERNWPREELTQETSIKSARR